MPRALLTQNITSSSWFVVSVSHTYIVYMMHVGDNSCCKIIVITTNTFFLRYSTVSYSREISFSLSHAATAGTTNERTWPNTMAKSDDNGNKGFDYFKRTKNSSKASNPRIG